jgi:hypothetical protein
MTDLDTSLSLSYLNLHLDQPPDVPTTVEPIISLDLTDIDLLLPKPKSCADVGILFRDVQRNCELKRSLFKYTK